MAGVWLLIGSDIGQSFFHPALRIGLGDHPASASEILWDALRIGCHEQHSHIMLIREATSHVDACQSIGQMNIHEGEVGRKLLAKGQSLVRRGGNSNHVVPCILEQAFKL